MEDVMSGRKITHEVKLPTSLTVIRGLIAVGLVGNLAVKTVQPAWAMGQAYVYGVEGAPLYVKQAK
jgi:hypothetical protein